MFTRARFIHFGSLLPALGLGLGSADCSVDPASGPAPIQTPACAPFDYVVAPRAAGSLCVALPCSLLTPAPSRIKADGDTLYYSDQTQILTFDANGQPQPIVAPPAVTETESDRTTLTWQPQIDE